MIQVQAQALAVLGKQLLGQRLQGNSLFGLGQLPGIGDDRPGDGGGDLVGEDIKLLGIRIFLDQQGNHLAQGVARDGERTRCGGLVHGSVLVMAWAAGPRSLVGHVRRKAAMAARTAAAASALTAGSARRACSAWNHNRR